MGHVNFEFGIEFGIDSGIYFGIKILPNNRFQCRLRNLLRIGEWNASGSGTAKVSRAPEVVLRGKGLAYRQHMMAMRTAHGVYRIVFISEENLFWVNG